MNAKSYRIEKDGRFVDEHSYPTLEQACWVWSDAPGGQVVEVNISTGEKRQVPPHEMPGATAKIPKTKGIVTALQMNRWSALNPHSVEPVNAHNVSTNFHSVRKNCALLVAAGNFHLHDVESSFDRSFFKFPCLFPR
jgi:hypothetical protein